MYLSLKKAKKCPFFRNCLGAVFALSRTKFRFVPWVLLVEGTFLLKVFCPCSGLCRGSQQFGVWGFPK